MSERRKSLGVSQQEVADVLGLSRPTILKIEKKKRELTEDETEKLEEFFDSLTDDNPNMRINIPQKNIEKFKQVFIYMLEKVGARPNIGLTVLYKLLYFIDFDYYEKYETQLMGLTYFKNKHGPTPREFKIVVDDLLQNKCIEEIKSTYFKREQKKYLPHISSDLSVLNGQELEMIDSVLERYADKNAKQISDMSHRDTPWKVTDNGEDIEYELAFYRADEFSVREYETL